MTDMNWKINPKNTMELIGYDEDMTEQVRVCTGATIWTFKFKHWPGAGRVRLGIGCDYNPLEMITSMFNHVAYGGVAPLPSVTFDEEATSLSNWEDFL